MNMENRPLISALEAYTKEKTARYHMPGHRNEERIPSLSHLKSHLYDYDVTEIEGTDHLHHPEECIRESQLLLTEAMGSFESLYCVNGSTAANYAMIFGLLKPGDEVLVERNCHQSIFHALSLRALKPRFLLPKLEENFLLPLPFTPEVILEACEKHPAVKGVILTSPNYYGQVTPLEEIAKELKKHGRYLMVDEAHGAHFAFSKRLPPTALSMGAHVSTVSFHKTLPALTQGAVLNLSSDLTESERKRIRHYLRLFQTSSPSYTLLASMENARALMQEEGEVLYEALLTEIKKLKENLQEISQVQVYQGNDRYTDETRLVLKTPLPGEVLLSILRKKYKIQGEMAIGNLLVLILSPFDLSGDLKKLPEALAMILKESRDLFQETFSAVLPEDLEPTSFFSETEEILFMAQEEIPIEEAYGRISAETLTPYPPGIPILLPGERIGEKEQKFLKTLFDQSAVLKSSSTTKMGITVLTKKEDL